MKPSALALVLATGCSSALDIPADRAILDWTSASAAGKDRSQLPQGFSAPDVHVCAADPTRAYLAELFVNGLDNPQVLWHWAPVVPGPNRSLPTLQQPEFSISGAVAQTDDSNDDVLADHPFGTDVDVDIAPDAPYAFMPFQPLRSSFLHAEVEVRAFPRAALGFAPQAGDRTLMRGNWVLDCGHPPYGAEMHPPTFMSFARALDPRTTIAALVVVPYRSSLLFAQDPGTAIALANTARFSLSSTRPFPTALVNAVEEAIFLGEQHIATHSLMVANRFDSLDFIVCAPLPKPPGAMLRASWRLTARSGISVSASEIGSAGCVRFVAAMSASYSPMPLSLQLAEWSWQAMSDSASSQLGATIDVRQAIISALQARGFNASNSAALQPQNSPLVDAYAALATEPGADQDLPTQVVGGADDQPFPMYGRVRVGWAGP